jgi:hypothetical protein
MQDSGCWIQEENKRGERRKLKIERNKEYPKMNREL